MVGGEHRTTGRAEARSVGKNIAYGPAPIINASTLPPFSSMYKSHHVRLSAFGSHSGAAQPPLKAAELKRRKVHDYAQKEYQCLTNASAACNVAGAMHPLCA